MDPIHIEKIQAINKYKKQQFFSKLIFYSLLALACSLVFSSFWFPCMKGFLLTSLPYKLASFFFSPKFLFIIGNLIVVFLVGESKIFPSKAKGGKEVYSNKYIISGSGSSHGNLQAHKDVNFSKTEVKKRSEKIFVNVKREKYGFIYEEDDEVIDGISMEEMSLTKRADNYIARVNKQRRLEACEYKLGPALRSWDQR